MSQGPDSTLLVPIGPGIREIAGPLVFNTTFDRCEAVTRHLEALAPTGDVHDVVYRLARLGLLTLDTIRSDTLELKQMRKETRETQG